MRDPHFIALERSTFGLLGSDGLVFCRGSRDEPRRVAGDTKKDWEPASHERFEPYETSGKPGPNGLHRHQSVG